jgi:hypothetical protein
VSTNALLRAKTPAPAVAPPWLVVRTTAAVALLSSRDAKQLLQCCFELLPDDWHDDCFELLHSNDGNLLHTTQLRQRSPAIVVDATPVAAATVVVAYAQPRLLGPIGRPSRLPLVCPFVGKRTPRRCFERLSKDVENRCNADCSGFLLAQLEPEQSTGIFCCQFGQCSGATHAFLPSSGKYEPSVPVHWGVGHDTGAVKGKANPSQSTIDLVK